MTTDTTSAPSHSDELDHDVARLLDASNLARVAALTVEPDADPADRRYAADVAAAVAQLECDLALAHVARAASGAVGTDDVRASAGELVDQVHTWFDDLAVQARLGRMDARDSAEAVTQRIRRAADDARAAATNAAEVVSGDLAEVRKAVAHAGESVRQAVADAVAAVREVAAGEERAAG